MQEEQKCTEGEKIKHRTHNAKCNHKLADDLNVPSSRIIDHFVIDTVGSDRHLWKIGEHVGKQNLLG